MISEAVEEVLHLVQNATQMFKAMNANPDDIIVRSKYMEIPQIINKL